MHRDATAICPLATAGPGPAAQAARGPGGGGPGLESKARRPIWALAEPERGLRAARELPRARLGQLQRRAKRQVPRVTSRTVRALQRGPRAGHGSY